MINLHQLRTFYHVAKNLSFTRAARELFITQPAVTAQIKALEGYCDLKLFMTRGRKVFLTDQGRALFAYAQRLLDLEREIHHALGEMKELKRGVLRLGTTKTYARYFMPLLISTFRGRHPQIKIQLHEGSSRDMTLGLLDFRVEIAIIAKTIQHPAVRFTPLSREDLVVIAAPTHPLVRKGSVPVPELAREPIIMKEPGSGTRKVVSDLLARHGCAPNILMETSNTEFIKAEVQRGEGIAFLVKAAVAHELEQGILAAIPISGCRPTLRVGIAHLEETRLSPPAKAFLAMLERVTEKARPHEGISALMRRMGGRSAQGASP